MKITTRIIVTVERSNGSAATLDRIVSATTGDNPSFERTETAAALKHATDQFIETNSLAGTRPL